MLSILKDSAILTEMKTIWTSPMSNSKDRQFVALGLEDHIKAQDNMHVYIHFIIYIYDVYIYTV